MKFHSLSFKLPALISVLCAIIALLMSVEGYLGARGSLKNDATERLTLALHATELQLESWLHEVEEDLDVQAENPSVIGALRLFTMAWDALGDEDRAALVRAYRAGSTADSDAAAAYNNVHARFSPFFEALRDAQGYADVLLVDAEGRVIYSVEAAADFGTVLTPDGGPMGRAVDRAQTAGGKTVFQDFTNYAALDGTPAAFLTHDVADRSGASIGTIVYRLSPESLARSVDTAALLGDTGRINVVGTDLLRRSASMFEDGGEVLEPYYDPETAQRVLDSEGLTVLSVADSHGDAVMAVAEPFSFMGTTWAMIALQSEAELMAPARDLARTFAMYFAVAFVVSLVLGFVAARGVTKALESVTKTMDEIAARNFGVKITRLKRRDEIGDIVRRIDEFRDQMAMAAVNEQQGQFQASAFANSSTAMLMADLDGMIVNQNKVSEAYFSDNMDEVRSALPAFPDGSLIGRNIDIFHKDPQRIHAILRDRSKLPHQADVRLGNLNVSLSISPIVDESGAHVGNVLVWDDVSEIRTTQGIINAIRRSQAVVEYDLDGRILETNDVMLDVTGYGRDELIGQPGKMLVGDGNGISDTTWSRIIAGEPFAERLARVDRNGKPIWMDVNFNTVRGAQGQPMKVVEISRDATSEEEARQAFEAERARTAASQDEMISSLRNGLSALADGNLVERLEEPFSQEYEQLREDFNAASDRLSGAIGQLVEAADAIRAGSRDISQASDDLSRRTESQAATLEETAAALDELTASVKSSAARASEADTIVQEARTNAQTSGEVVVEAVTAMSEIEKSSDQINQIIGVIDDIAFQTNLLALNAGVEAARAGEAGRGFAVVASEVRALAQRSSEAAKEIKALISTSSSHVERGVSLVGKTGDALKEIVDSVAHISSLVSEISSSSKEQSTGLSEINTGVTQLDQVTQQNAAMVEEATAASHSLRGEAESLGELAGIFRITRGESGGGTVVDLSPRAPAGGAPVKPQLSAPAPDEAPRAASGGGGGGWEDF
ncbi:methyl-accepting chemotaxis protein [Mesobaculum littorinae]